MKKLFMIALLFLGMISVFGQNSNFRPIFEETADMFILWEKFEDMEIVMVHMDGIRGNDWIDVTRILTNSGKYIIIVGGVQEKIKDIDISLDIYDPESGYVNIVEYLDGDTSYETI